MAGKNMKVILEIQQKLKMIKIFPRKYISLEYELEDTLVKFSNGDRMKFFLKPFLDSVFKLKKYNKTLFENTIISFSATRFAARQVRLPSEVTKLLVKILTFNNLLKKLMLNYLINYHDDKLINSQGILT